MASGSSCLPYPFGAPSPSSFNNQAYTQIGLSGNYYQGLFNLVLLEKVEELTLYILDLQEQINELKK